jgi:hypothetical protein
VEERSTENKQQCVMRLFSGRRRLNFVPRFVVAAGWLLTRRDGKKSRVLAIPANRC